MARKADRRRVPPEIAAEVIRRWGNDCWLNMPGCTRVSDTTDHVLPYAVGGPTIVANLRRACRHCNGLRADRIFSGHGATIHAVIGPPASGKSTWVDMHAGPGAVVLDFDRIARGMAGDRDGGDWPAWVRRATAAAWYGAYGRLVRCADPVDVWLVRCQPSTPHSPRLLEEWIALGYDIHVCDPGKAEVLERSRARPHTRGEGIAIGAWYRSGITQAKVDAMVARRASSLASLGFDGYGSAACASSSASGSRPAW